MTAFYLAMVGLPLAIIATAIVLARATGNRDRQVQEGATLPGTAVTVIWQYTPVLEPIVYELVPAFTASLLVTVVVSRLTRAPNEVDALFDSMVPGPASNS